MTVVPTSATCDQRMRCQRDDGGRPPKIRVAEHGAAEQRRDDRRLRAVGQVATVEAVHLEVVDRAHGHAVDVEDLPVQQVQTRVEHEPGRAARPAGGRS